MKVVYKKDIFDKINDEIVLAKRNNKEIDYIELNKSEWNGFGKFAPGLDMKYVGSVLYDDSCAATYNGVDIFLEE